MPVSRNKNAIIARLLKKSGKRALIDANCVQCVYDETERGTYRKQVWECSARDCVFYSVRLRPRSAVEEARSS